MSRRIAVVATLLGGLVLSVLAGLSIGSEAVSLAEVAEVLGIRLTGSHGAGTVTEQIVWNLRLPRIILAAIVGGGLSVVGVAMQALVRNPLAEPYVLGISSGAAAGASLFFLGFIPSVFASSLTLPLAAFVGGLISVIVVFLVASEGSRISVARLLLAGVAMSALMGSITSLVTFASPDPDRLRTVLFWLLGSFSEARWSLLPIPVGISLLGLVALMAAARPMDAFLLGEEPARSLGVRVEGLKRGLIAVAVLVTGSLVSVSGAIGFVGLIVPHAVRTVTGTAHSRLIPVSFIAGAIFMIWADILARSMLRSQDLPVGIVTAACGVPFFLVLLRRSAYRFGA